MNIQVNSIEEGARELLETVAVALTQVDVGPYMVIGGWCPVLRNKTHIKHPGTIDVDILFEYGYAEGYLAPLFSAFKDLGFGVSAKHGFQLLRETKVKGESVLFNVDILHPLMTEKSSTLFQDHLELDIPIDEEERRLKKLMSIVQPNSRILFDEKLYSKFSLGEVEIPLVDFTGMFLTKIDSCQKAKRERDSLDLLIAVESNGVDFGKITEVRSINPRIDKSCRNFEEHLRCKANTFDDNVNYFVDLEYSPAGRILEAINYG